MVKEEKKPNIWTQIGRPTDGPSKDLAIPKKEKKKEKKKGKSIAEQINWGGKYRK